MYNIEITKVISYTEAMTYYEIVINDEYVGLSLDDYPYDMISMLRERLSLPINHIKESNIFGFKHIVFDNSLYMHVNSFNVERLLDYYEIDYKLIKDIREE